MAASFNPLWVKGKVVARIDTNPRSRGEGYGAAPTFDPVIVFTDGSKLLFTAEEGAYEPGVGISYLKAKP